MKLYTGLTSSFQNATFLQLHYEAFKLLESITTLPSMLKVEWTDIAVLDGIYYAVFGTDTIMTNAPAIYTQIEPTEEIINKFNILTKEL